MKRHPHDKEFLVTHATSGYEFVLMKIDILLEGNMTPISNLILQMHLICLYHYLAKYQLYFKMLNLILSQ